MPERKTELFAAPVKESGVRRALAQIDLYPDGGRHGDHSD